MLPLKSGNSAKAKRAATHFLRIAPEHPWGHAALGDAAHADGNVSEAIRHYLDAARLDPANADFRTAYGRAQLELKWWALPLIYFRKLGAAWGLILQLCIVLAFVLLDQMPTGVTLLIVWGVFWLYCGIIRIVLLRFKRRQAA